MNIRRLGALGVILALILIAVLIVMLALSRSGISPQEIEQTREANQATNVQIIREIRETNQAVIPAITQTAEALMLLLKDCPACPPMTATAEAFATQLTLTQTAEAPE